MTGILFVVGATEVNATHISGSDLTYRWISGNTFELELSLYRDCSGLAAPNSVSVNCRSASAGHSLQVTLLQKPGTGQEITRPCITSNTTCNGGTNPGIQKFVYTGTVDLPTRCSDWIFGYNICCRNCAITTLNFSSANCAGAPATYVEATLNNILAPTNSSASFSNQPIAFLCIGQPMHYNHGAYDVDGDSIVYAFIPARSQTGTNVVYSGSYSAINPISSTPSLSLSGNGEMLINPTAMEVGVMAILVSEYRAGVLIGSVVRDMQVYTQNCSNSLPSVSGINGTSEFTIVACPGIATQFTIQSVDPDAQQAVNMTWDAGIPGANFSVSTGSRPIGTFTWTPHKSEARLQAYTFTVTVQDENCPINGSQTFTFSVLVPPLSVAVSTNPALCTASASGTATAVPEGTPPFRYLWAPGGATTSSIYGLTPSIYTITVTDKHGCTASGTGSVNSPIPLSASVVSTVPVSCYGGNNGAATISATGGTPPYNYSWLPYGGNLPTATGLVAGLYTITIRDANNCQLPLDLNISQAPPFNLSYSTIPAGCGLSNGSASVTASGGTHPLTYSWSPGGMTTTSISNIASGSYQIRVTDAQNCVLTSSIAVSNTSGPSAQISTLNHVTCNGKNDGNASVTTSSGTAPFSYRWSVSGITTPFISNLAAGNYSVAITDSNNCVTAIPVTINEPPALFSYGQTVPANCYGQNSGQASVTVNGGIPPYFYSWSNGQTTQSLSQLTGGSYTVTITDSNGCIDVSSMMVGQPSALILQTISTPVQCFNGSDGVASAQCSGGTPGYTYVWSNGSNSMINPGLSVGTYMVTITDAQGCTETNTTTITQPDEINLTVTGQDATCFGQNNGSATIQATGGTSPYSFFWSPIGVNGSSVSQLHSGLYTVITSDNHGCTRQESVTINSPNQIQPVAQTQDVTCFGGNDGNASISCSGGVGPYQYLWPDGSTNSTNNHLSAGMHTIEITDQVSCISNYEIHIAEPNQLQIVFDTIRTLCIGESITISPNVTGGITPYTYLWNNGQSGLTLQVSPQQTQSYSIQVRDSNGCSLGPVSTLVDVFPPLDLSINSPDSVCIGSPALISVNVNGGNGGPYTYQWTTGQNVQSITVVPTATSNYSVTVNDQCSTPPAEKFKTIVVKPIPDASFLPANSFGCSPLQVQFINANPGINLIRNEWDFGDGNYSLEENPVHFYTLPGQYTVKHVSTNQHNCSSQNTAVKAVTVFNLSNAKFKSDPEIAPSSAPLVSFTDESENAIKYFWDFGDGHGASVLKNPHYLFGDTGTYNVRLITESRESCRDTVYGTIRIKGEFAIYIPNAFTPNGDGVNDTFGPLSIGVKEMEMEIYNRWGQKIFQSSKLNASWSGKNSEGGTLNQEGVYLYKITVLNLDGNRLNYTGRISLIY